VEDKGKGMTLERAFHLDQNNNPFEGIERRALLR
jgi:hypothetical protein